MRYKLPHVDLDSCNDHMRLDGRCRLCRILVLLGGVVIWMILGVLVVAVFVLLIVVGVIYCWCICCYSIIMLCVVL
jgi:fatty acid desaturase